MLGFEQNADLLVFFCEMGKIPRWLINLLATECWRLSHLPTWLGSWSNEERERESLSIILDVLKAERFFWKCVKSTMTKESIRECFGVAWDHSKQLSDTSDLI